MQREPPATSAWTVSLRSFAVGACMVLAGACTEPESGPVAGEDLTSVQATYVNYGMQANLTDQGVRTGEVRADSAYYYAESGTTHLFSLTMTLYQEETGREQAVVVADSAHWVQRTQRMEAWGDVVVTLPADGTRIETSVLHYDPERRQIWTDAPFTRRDGTDVTTGTGFESDLRFEEFSIRNFVGPLGGSGEP